MKLKSILIMTMVAIMAIAGGAIAATTTTTINATLDTPGFAGGVSMTFGTAPVCNSVAGATTACAAMTAAQATAFVTESQTGTGTGLAGGMPAQVVYDPNALGAGLGQYTAGVGPQTGYAISQTLFGMCAMTGGVVGACPKFVPAPATASAATIQGLIIAEGGGNAADGGAGTITTSTIPSGTGNFNQATFMTDIVGSMVTAGVINNNFSQKTTHHSTAANATGSADADFIDQRLSQVLGTVQTLAQATTIGASGDGLAVVVTQDPNSLDPGWIGNVDPYAWVGAGGALAQSTNTVAMTAAQRTTYYTALNADGALAGNGGAISQAIADSNSAGAGDYGQLFTNDDVSVVSTVTPAPVPGAATIYNAVSPLFGGAAGGTLPTLP